MTNQTKAEALALADEAWSFDASAHGSTKSANAEMLCLLQDCATTIRKLVAENERIGAAHAADYAKLQGYLGALSAAEARIAELEAQAQPAREPLDDDEIQRLYADLQERLAPKQEALYQSRIGMQCGMCAEGRYQASHNGYSKFHRCDKCNHVPLWMNAGTEFASRGTTKEKQG